MKQKTLQKNKPIISVRNRMAALFVVLITLMSANIFAQTTDLVKFSFNGLSAYGPSPLTPSVTAANITAVGLTTGSGLGTINTAATNAWGGTAANTAATQSAATSSNNVVTFSLTANTGYKLSLTQIPAYNIRRSGTGFSTGIWQYSINGGTFNDIGSSITWTSTSTSGVTQPSIALSGISALQNVAAGNTITLRVVLWGASGTGSWYFYQPVAGTNNLIVTGTVALESVAPTPTCVANITASGATTFCSGGNVTLTANAGSSYLWSNGATTQSISATTSGTYSVIVTNANGCSASTSIIVTEAPPLVATITSNAPNTTICNDGTAVLSASISGGLGNIDYQWQFQDNSGNWVNVSGTGWAGTNVATPFTSSGRNASPSATRAYRIVVTSVANNQCSVIATQLVTVIADPVFTITSTNISCFGANNGTATAVLTGGLALNYGYNWYSNDGISTNNNPTGDGTLSVNGLFPAQWVINTTVSGSSFGCYAEASVNITQPALLVASSISGSILCNGGSTNVTVSSNGGNAPYTGIGVFNVSAGSYNYTVTDANGCSANTSINVSEPTALVANSSASAILCNGGSAVVSVSANGGTGVYVGTGDNTVSAGSYNYAVTDANGCSANTSINVSEPSALIVNSSASSILCNGGTAVVSVSANGGTGVYVGTGDNTVTAGSYNYTVTDANGCSASTSIIVNQPTALSANAGTDKVVYFGYLPMSCATLNGSATGGTGSLSYSWSNGTTTTNNTVCPSITTSYSLTATDANGCTVTDDVKVCVVNVVCYAGNSNVKKVEVCHKGNTICIDANGVQAHLAHGCALGSCTEVNACNNLSSRMVINESTSDETVMSEIKLFPNPAKDNLMITLSNIEEMGSVSYSIINAIGQEVYTGTLNSTETTINISTLNSGMYYFKTNAQTTKPIIFVVQ